MKYIYTGFFAFLLLNFSQISVAQQASKKGDFYLYWGWNGSNYTKSNTTFSGADYDFTIQKMRAKDRQSPLSWDYINPTQMTIPQYNLRFGYFITDRWSISLGTDHMKYVMEQNQVADINGKINIPGNEFNGTYNNTPVELTPNFLKFEHTDGLNYANAEVRYEMPLYFWRIGKKGKGIDFSVLGGVGAGVLYPKTNTSLLGKERYDEFHLSGWGTSAVVGAKARFLKYLFIQAEFKGGYIDMPNIRTTQYSVDKAQQSFGFIQYNILFGGQVNLIKKKKD